MKFVKRLLWRLQYERSRQIELDGISAFSSLESRQEFLRFDEYLTYETGTRLEALYKLRFQEIDRMIQRCGVRSVCEMGSGRTTFFFNLYRDLNFVSYEQDERWREVMLGYYAGGGKSSPRIEHREVEPYKDGGRFAGLLEQSCDLLYIDGPFLVRDGNKFGTYKGKPAYYDFEKVLEFGLPKVIMVEGRTDTVDEILRSSFIDHYDFHGELTWALERGKLKHVFRLGRHSIFILKQYN